ncbi:MAG: protein-disulfide reductase DsbD family protein [Edaphocola sp.]
MKIIIRVCIAILCLLPMAARAQTAGNPVSWQFSVKKMENDVYRFEAKATIGAGYHVWALDPGGDGSLIPTSFTSEQLPGGWVGEWKESTAPKKIVLDYMDGNVRWHEKAITFYRDFKGKKGDKVKGAVQFQTCNEKMCLPPAIENFVVSVNQ